MAKRIILLATCFWWALVAWGQSAPGEGFVQTSFGFVGGGVYRNLFYKTFTENPEDPPVYRALNFSTSNLLAENPYFGPPAFEVYWREKDEQYRLIQSFPIPKPPRRQNFIMWLENPREVKKGEAPRLKFVPFNPSLKEYPYNTVTVMNFTAHPIAGKVGGEVLKNIGQAGSTTKVEGRTLPIDLYTYDNSREKIMPAYTANFATGRKSRFFVLLFPTERGYPFYMDAKVISDTEQPSQRERDNIRFETN